MKNTSAVALPSLRWRLGFGACLVLAMGMAPLVQYSLGVLAPFIIDDLGLSRTQIGALVSALYGVAAVGAPFLGRVVDALGGRKVLLGLFASGAVALLLLSAGGGYPWLVAGSALAGVAMGSANPVTNALVGSFIPAGRRGLLMGVKQSGVMVGQSLAGIAAPSLALLLGWRASLRFGIVIALLGAGMTIALLPRASRPAVQPSVDVRAAALPGFVTQLALYGFLMGNGQATFGTYLALYAVEQLQFTATAAGLVASVSALIGVAARIASGRLAERLSTVRTALVVLATGGACAMALMVAAQIAGAWTVWLAAVIFGATAQVWNVIGMLALLRRVDAASTGRATGTVMMGFLSGFIAGPIAFGALVDLTAVYTYSWLGVLATYIAAAALAGAGRELREPLPAR